MRRSDAANLSGDARTNEWRAMDPRRLIVVSSIIDYAIKCLHHGSSRREYTRRVCHPRDG